MTPDAGESVPPLPTSCGPFGNTVGPDGALWFPGANTDRIGRISSVGEAAGGLLVGGGFQVGITVGPGGARWWAHNQAEAIGSITATGTRPLPAPAAALVGITSGGTSLWFTEAGVGCVDRVAMDGVIDEFPLPDPGCRSHARAASNADDCWSTEIGANHVGHTMVRDTSAKLSKGNLLALAAEPHGLTPLPDAGMRDALNIGSVIRTGWAGGVSGVSPVAERGGVTAPVQVVGSTPVSPCTAARSGGMKQPCHGGLQYPHHAVRHGSGAAAEQGENRTCVS